MRELKYFVACTLDRFIASEDGQVFVLAIVVMLFAWNAGST